MEYQIKLKESYGIIRNKLDKIKENTEIPEINKIIHKCESIYLDVLNCIDNIKKQEIECFNWFEIYVKIVEFEKYVTLSKTFDNNCKIKDVNLRNSKEYIISKDKKRIYKIVSKPAEQINNSLDPDYYKNFSILDVISNFVEDANSLQHFPYKKDVSQLIIVFKENPNESVLDEIKNAGLISFSISTMPINPIIYKNEIVNIDINIIIALCSDVQYLQKDSDIIKKILNDKIYIGYDLKNIDNMNYEDLCKYIVSENDKIIEEIKKYNKAIICKSAYEDCVRILNLIGSDSEKQKLEKIINLYNIEIIDNYIYDNNLIEDLSKKYNKLYNKVEREVLKIGYIFNAITLTSNHRFAEFLISHNVLIEYKNITSLNLISTVKNKTKIK